MNPFGSGLRKVTERPPSVSVSEFVSWSIMLRISEIRQSDLPVNGGPLR